MPLIRRTLLGAGATPTSHDMAALFRLFALVALVLMPFTMAGAPAKAHATPAVADGHCGEHPAAPAGPAIDMAQCMLMCAALPAAEQIAMSPPALPAPPPVLGLSSKNNGIILEIATPPPRHD